MFREGGEYQDVQVCARLLSAFSTFFEPSALGVMLLAAINRLCICTPASVRRLSAHYLVLTSSPLRHMLLVDILFQLVDIVVYSVENSVGLYR